jgi:plastocyanin
MKRLCLLFRLAGCSCALPAEAAAPLGRVQVVALEFHYRLSRVSVPAGQVRIELANFGQDEHDLTLRKVGTTKVYSVPSALPGRRETVTLRLKPGLYVLKCTMADHAMRGMKAQLRVRPRA